MGKEKSGRERAPSHTHIGRSPHHQQWTPCSQYASTGGSDDWACSAALPQHAPRSHALDPFFFFKKNPIKKPSFFFLHSFFFFFSSSASGQHFDWLIAITTSLQMLSIPIMVMLLLTLRPGTMRIHSLHRNPNHFLLTLSIRTRCHLHQRM